jgi:hypothetical protein
MNKKKDGTIQKNIPTSSPKKCKTFTPTCIPKNFLFNLSKHLLKFFIEKVKRNEFELSGQYMCLNEDCENEWEENGDNPKKYGGRYSESTITTGH